VNVDHYKIIYRKLNKINIFEILQSISLFNRSLLDEQNDSLNVHVSEEELTKVINSFQSDKSLGLNGWTIEFFEGFFKEIGEYLSLVVEEPRSMGKVFCPFNSTFIANIPKTNNPLSFDSYKSISLCRCVYKTVPKLYSLNMLEPILSSFVSDEQFGFLPGRQIFDAVGITQEVSILLNQRSLPPPSSS
jgi:hypothetical protein